MCYVVYWRTMPRREALQRNIGKLAIRDSDEIIAKEILKIINK